jgi:hypothetical protein
VVRALDAAASVTAAVIPEIPVKNHPPNIRSCWGWCSIPSRTPTTGGSRTRTIEIMRRPTRQFLPRPMRLEARSLLATSHASQVLGYMGIEGQGVPMIYMQQDGPITLQLYRIPTKGTSQVRVTSNPSTPAADAVVPPIDQTVTFADGQGYVPMTVPVNPGASNPGEVDVSLNLTPINSSQAHFIAHPAKLRIFASSDALPPKIVSAQGTPQGIVLTFDKPMDPAGASNVKNYALSSSSSRFHPTNDLLGNVMFYGSLGTLWPSAGTVSTSVHAIRLKSAQYDPSTNAVTLVPQSKLTYRGNFDVSQGPASTPSSGTRNPSKLGPRLTDVEGNPINDFVNAPGVFGFHVTKPA